ncbi:MAG TPA: biotin transporter BioY [Edaphobacter sp.]|nr:biotin transporter BioY [Edaphobacter sp.]
MQTALPSTSGLAHQPSRSLSDSIPGRIAVALAATLFIAACARISIPLPFTPVPLSLQNFGVLLVGLTLGPVAGFSALALYLAEAAMGLPVLTPHGPGGLAQMLGPSGGYLLSYPFVAAVAGWAFRSLRRGSAYARAALACTLATFVLFACGSLWLTQALHAGAPAVWTMAVAPFLPGEVVKIAAAAGLATSIARLRRA